MVAQEQVETPPVVPVVKDVPVIPDSREIMQYRAKLAQKKLKAQGLIGWVKKNGVLKGEKITYNYAAAADVIAAAREALEESGIAFVSRNPKVTREVLVPSQKCKGQYGDYEKPGMFLYTLEIDLGFVDTETGYEEMSRCIGEGSDSGDKGIPKANTNTLKYFLIQQLLIPTGDDPEKDPSPGDKKIDDEKGLGSPPASRKPYHKGKDNFYGNQGKPAPRDAANPVETVDTTLPADEPPMVDQIADGLLGKEPDEFASDNALPPYNEKSKKIMDGLFDYYKSKIADMEGLAFNALKLRALVWKIGEKIAIEKKTSPRWPETAVGATTIKSKIKPEEVADKV